MAVDGLFRRAESFLNTQMLRAQSLSGTQQTVAYSRGSASATLSAVIGSTAWEQTSQAGAIIVFNSEDFIVAVADMATGGFAPPQAGDRIVYGGATFQVAPMGDSPCWQPSGDLYYRIHTKRVRSA